MHVPLALRHAIETLYDFHASVENPLVLDRPSYGLKIQALESALGIKMLPLRSINRKRFVEGVKVLHLHLEKSHTGSSWEQECEEKVFELRRVLTMPPAMEPDYSSLPLEVSAR